MSDEPSPEMLDELERLRSGAGAVLTRTGRDDRFALRTEILPDLPVGFQDYNSYKIAVINVGVPWSIYLTLNGQLIAAPVAQHPSTGDYLALVPLPDGTDYYEVAFESGEVVVCNGEDHQTWHVRVTT